MIIDCGRCAERRDECHGCLVSVLHETPDGIGDLTPGELRAIETFELAGFEVELLETPGAARRGADLPAPPATWRDQPGASLGSAVMMTPRLWAAGTLGRARGGAGRAMPPW